MSYQSPEAYVYGSGVSSARKEFCFDDNAQVQEPCTDACKEKIRVLLLDWSDASLKFLKNKIERDKNIEVIGMARNGHEARNMIIALDPDLLIMDILSPNSGGIEFLKRLNRFCPKPVLLLSHLSKMPSQLVMSAFEAGVTDLIDKDAFSQFDRSSISHDYLLCKKIKAVAS